MYPNLPFPSEVYVPFDIFTAEEVTRIDANIKSLAAGTGFNPGAITTDTLAESAVTKGKLAYESFVSFEAVMSTAQSIPSSVYTKPNFNTVNYDNTSSYNPSNSTFTVPDSGAYLITLNVSSSGIPGTCAIDIDGSQARRSFYTGLSSMITPLSCQVKLTAGQRVTPSVYVNSAATLNGSITQTWFTATRVA